MCHLYDIDEDNMLIKHSNFKHDRVQGAMATAQAECDFPIKWTTELNITKGRANNFPYNDQIYEIIE